MGLDQNKWGLKFMTTNNQTSIASLAKKRRTYSAEFKQQIVQACKATFLRNPKHLQWITLGL